MNIAQLVRLPLFWIVVVEIAIVSALVFVVWHALQTHQPGSPSPLPGLSALAQNPNLLDPLANLPQPAPTGAPPQTGSALTPEASSLNRAEGSWANAEWSIIDALMKAARGYIENTVLPAVERAEKRT